VLPLVLLLLLVSQSAAGPFTRAPWGRQVWASSAADAGRGGAGLADTDSTRLNLRNPAAVHGGRLTRFQIGFTLNRAALSSADENLTTSGGRFDYFALAFPLLWKDLSLALGLRPQTGMDFSVARRETDQEGREYVNSLHGTGGLSLVHLSLARSMDPLPLKVGLEAGLVFGSLLEEWKVFYPQSAPPYDSWINRRLSLVALRPRLGLLWSPGPRLDLALAAAPAVSAELSIDLENRSSNVDQEYRTAGTDLPARLDVGLRTALMGLDFWTDLSYEDWSGTELYGSGDGSTAAERRQDVLGLALGVELPPSSDYTDPWYRQASWRGGLRREEHYANWNSAADGAAPDWRGLETLTFSLGAGLPLRTSSTWLDLALELGWTGSLAEHGLKERFVNLRVGLSARDLWFWRPSYD